MIENLKNIRNIFQIPELRNRVMFTFALLAVYRIGAQVPTPGINPAALQEFFRSMQGTVLGFLNIFSGRALEQMTIFALGIMPYISASIILQLLTVVWPYLEKLSKEGEQGRKKITQWTRYGTVVLALIQSFGIALSLEQMDSPGTTDIVPSPGWGFRLTTMLTLTTGTAFIMWLGEQITERGIGNGISLIIFAGIVVGLVPATVDTFLKVGAQQLSIITLAVLIIMMIVVVAAIVFVERGQRKIPVQYARRMVGRRFVSGQATHLPLRVNMSGVIPPIFASSIIMLPQTLAQVAPNPAFQYMAQQLSWGMPLYDLLYVAAIVFFAFFYSEIIFNPVDMADNLKKYGGFIPGIRPGKKTADYIYRIMRRLTAGGAVYLAAVCLLPEFLLAGFKLQYVPGIGAWLERTLDTLQLGFITEGLGVNFFFGGTSLLIVVGVAMDTVQQIESQLIMRHYDGFLKGGRLRGRRG